MYCAWMQFLDSDWWHSWVILTGTKALRGGNFIHSVSWQDWVILMGTTVLAARGCNFLHLVSWRLNYSDGNHCTYCEWMQFPSFSLVTELSYNSALSQDCMDEIASTHSTFVPNTTTLLSRETERSTFRFPFKLNFHTMKCLTPLFLENSWWQFYWPWKLHVNNHTTLITIEQHQ